MPATNNPVFQQKNDENFQDNIPLLFVVKARIRRGEEGKEGEVVAEGRWEEVFSVVEGGGEGVEVVEMSWMCGDSSVGYSV